MTAPTFSLRFTRLALCIVFLSNGRAATVTKNDTTSLLSNASNWSAAPGATDIGSFNTTLSSGNAALLTLGGNVSIGNLTFGTMNGPVVITDTSTLTLNNATPLTATAASHSITFNHAVSFTLTGTSIFETNNSRPSASITFNGTLNSNGKVQLRAGNAVFAGGGTYTSIGIGSRSGVVSTIRLGADNGISTSASFSLGESNGTSSFTGGNDLAIQAIPEPGATLLGGLGLLMLLRRRR